MKILLAGLALASICSVNSYGPPPSKTKHRTTTTTISPVPDSGNLIGNSIYSPGSNAEQPNPCGHQSSNCGTQAQYPTSSQTGQPSVGPYSPSTSITSSQPSKGTTYWWQGPDSPFSPGKIPGAAPSQPQYPGSSQPGPIHQSPNQPGSTFPGTNQPGSSYPGTLQPDFGSETKPIDTSNNPFLSSALGTKPNGGGKPQFPSGKPGQTTYPTTGQPQYPGQSQYPGGQPQNPGAPISQPQYPGSSQGQPQYPGNSQPGSPSETKPIDISSNPFLSSALGINKPHGGGQPQFPSGQPGTPISQPQYPGSSQGQPQYPGNSQGQPQYSGVNPTQQPGPQGQPQYPGTSPSQQPGQPQYPVGTPSQQPVQQGQSQYPITIPGQPQTVGSSQGGQSSYPGSSPTQYPGSPSGQPQYPQYGSTSNNIPGANKFPPPFPGSVAPLGQSCNSPNHLCVTKSACYQGVLTQSGVPGRAGVCNAATEVCCKISTTPGQGSQAPPSVGYGTGAKPGTNGIPIGGSIYDNKPSFGSTPAPSQPYNGPLNTTPHPGCPAALKCVPISLCTAEGVMSNTPVYLTREQEESRVPLTDCLNQDTNTVGKCCRDPNYKDPWPAGMMMGKSPTGPADYDDGQYHPPEPETSNTFTHEAGIYYNVVSTTPKGYTIKPADNFNQKPTPFPTKPSVPVTSGREPAPVHENTFPEHSDTPGTLNTPSNEILPPQKGQPIPGYNQFPGTTSAEKPSVTILPQQPGHSGSSPNYQSQLPSYVTQPGLPNVQTTGYQPTQSNLGQPVSTVAGYQPSPSKPGQPGFPSTGYQPSQSTSGLPVSSVNGYQPSPSKPGQPGSPVTGYQPNQSTPEFPGSPSSGYQPGYSNTGQPNSPVPGYQPGYSTTKQPGSSATGYNPSQPTLSPANTPTTGYQTNSDYTPSVPAFGSTIEESYSTPSISTYTPRAHQAGQLSPGFAPGQVAPGTSCGIRHQASTNSPDEAGVNEFPWQAIVSSAADKKLLCGAAIISENAVITAAHCVENYRAKDLVIKAGIWKLFSPSETEQTRPVAAIARHPKYDSGSLSEDLAILIVSVSFTPTEHVDKICLPKSTGYRPQSNNCVVTGWGRQALKGPVPNSVLHKVDVFFIDNVKCEETLKGTHLGKYFILNKGFTCAVPKSSSDLCKVDVGGPLACDKGDGHYELAGVNSWDVGCSKDQTPTVFSNPDAEWIQNVISTPTEKLQENEEKYNADKSKGESLDQVDIDQKPGFALGYGK